MRFLVLLMISCLIGLQGRAQIDINDLLNGSITTTGATSDIITKAVTPALSIVRQQYRLERGGDFFGRRGRLYYGETYTLGVKVSNSTILQRGAVFPWENDADYKRVSADGKYTAANFHSMQRLLSNKEWKDVEFDFENLTKPKTADSLLYESLDKINDFGLPVDDTEGYKNGYLIWAYSSTNLQDSAMQVSLKQKSYSIEAKGNGMPLDVSPERADSVLGGVFVVTQVERVGYIKVFLVGVAVKNSAKEWKLELLTQKSNENKNEKPEKKKKKKDGTEISREKAETPADDSEPTPIK